MQKTIINLCICRNLQQTFILALHFVYFSCLLPSKFSVSTFKDENQSSGGLAISRKLLFVKLWQKINKLLFDVSAPMMFCFQKTLSSRLLNSFVCLYSMCFSVWLFTQTCLLLFSLSKYISSELDAYNNNKLKDITWADKCRSLCTYQGIAHSRETIKEISQEAGNSRW